MCKSRTMARIRIGISGWRYKPWRGKFYPEDLPQKHELRYAASQFPVLEINGSFYALQRPGSYALWYEETPDDFVFTVKAPRYITHIRRAKEVETPLANFFASGVFNLREKLGPILWQFPPNFKYDRERMETFLRLLPRDTDAARALARRHDAWMKDRVQLEIDASRPLRHAVEIRHESFKDESFVDLLREQGVALVVSDSPLQWPLIEDVTADFVYIRLHGDKELYASGYDDATLHDWARRIRAWHEGSEPADARKISRKKPPGRARRDVFCFFDNDAKVKAPADARSLMGKLSISPPAPSYRSGEAAARSTRPARGTSPMPGARRPETRPR